jgi:hypothetical protein
MQADMDQLISIANGLQGLDLDPADYQMNWHATQ